MSVRLGSAASCGARDDAQVVPAPPDRPLSSWTAWPSCRPVVPSRRPRRRRGGIPGRRRRPRPPARPGPCRPRPRHRSRPRRTRATAAHGGPVRVHDRFGTATLQLDGRRFDLARARRETLCDPGALPDVEPAPLCEDLRRRDFTVNALALGPGRRRGAASWWPCPAASMTSKRAGPARAPRRQLPRRSHPACFAWPATRGGWAGLPSRILRAWPRQALRDGALETVSGGRLGAELRLLGGESDPAAGLQWLERPGTRPGPAAARASRAARARRLDRACPGAAGRRRRSPGARAGHRRRRGRPPRAVGSPRRSGVPRRQPRHTIVAAASGAPSIGGPPGAAQQPSAIARTIAGAPPELVALAGALGPAPATEAARPLAGRAAPRRPGDRRPRPDGRRHRARAPPSDGGCGQRSKRGWTVTPTAATPSWPWPWRRPRRRLRPVLAPPFQPLGEHFAIDLPGARAVFTTRRGGHSAGPYASLNLGFRHRRRSRRRWRATAPSCPRSSGRRRRASSIRCTDAMYGG